LRLSGAGAGNANIHHRAGKVYPGEQLTSAIARHPTANPDGSQHVRAIALRRAAIFISNSAEKGHRLSCEEAGNQAGTSGNINRQKTPRFCRLFTPAGLRRSNFAGRVSCFANWQMPLRGERRRKAAGGKKQARALRPGLHRLSELRPLHADD